MDSPTEEDLKDDVQSIPTDSFPRPNGFGFGFFITYLDFIKDDLLEVGSYYFLQ